MGEVPGWWETGSDYPMDYYASDGGAWNSTYHRRKARPEGGAALPAGALAAIAAARRAAAGGAAASGVTAGGAS